MVLIRLRTNNIREKYLKINIILFCMVKRKMFSITDSSGVTWTPSEMAAIKEVKRLKASGKRKIIINRLIEKNGRIVQGKRISISKLIK